MSILCATTRLTATATFNHTNYLRYMQEASRAASAAPSYDTTPYPQVRRA